MSTRSYLYNCCLLGFCCALLACAHESKDKPDAGADAGEDAPVADGPMPDGMADAATGDAPTGDGPSARTACAVVRYDNLDDSTGDTLEIGGITVTGSGQLHVIKNGGIGVVDHMVNDDEWLLFTLPEPMLGVSYRLNGSMGPTGAVGATTIEAFDSQGNSLGTRSTTGVRIVDVSELFAHRLITSFKLQPQTNAGVRPGSVATGCCKYSAAFDQLASETVAKVTVRGVEVTGSADLKVQNGKGLGVVGSVDDLIDQDEWIRFGFMEPAIRITLSVSEYTEEYVGIDIESFDGEGTSRGSSSTDIDRGDDIRINAAEYEAASAVKIVADDSGEGHTSSGIEYWTICGN